ncbi:hypothetical protein BCR34DRAFT_591840 [Clohesyomyces aquaticus]|uniref:Uncharacterized protein n=1 Tax=Clohesyomyces aquaticus TaxID=1231657 RepID=A0A1Y1YX87_9PLEO|nr:hypothetical protein BCR34DRAFT_591840 [Clohesyomyces aquaticus]
MPPTTISDPSWGPILKIKDEICLIELGKMANSNSCLRFFYIFLLCTVLIQIQAYPLHAPILLASRATTTPLHCQTVAVWITNYFLVSQAHVVRNSVTVFSIALLAVTLVLAVHGPSTYAVEFFIVLQLFSWNCFSGVRSQTSTSHSSLPLQNKALRRSFTKGFTIAVVILHTWFWFAGLDLMQKPEEGCTAQVFFFARVDIDGWFRKLMKGVAMLEILYQISCLLTQILGLWSSGTRSQRKKLARQAVEQYELWETTENDHSPFPGPTIPAPEDEEDVGTAAWPTVSYASSEADTCSQTAMSPTWHTNLRDGKRISMSTMGASTHDGDEESISEKVERILYQTEMVKEDIPEIPNTPWTPGRLPSWHEPESPGVREVVCKGFEEIWEAECWMRKCVDAGSVKWFEGRYPRLYKILLSLRLAPGPLTEEKDEEEEVNDAATYHSRRSSSSMSTSTPNPPPPPPPYTTCLLSLLTAILTLRFPRRAATLVSHLLRARALNLVTGPYQLHAALTSSYPPTSPSPSLPTTTPSHTSLTLASGLLLSTLPPPTQSQKAKYIFAVLDALIHIFLILQLELTIRWNGVRGLGFGGLGSMGQSVPFVIGVAGLSVILWRLRWEVGKKKAEEDGDVKGVGAEVEGGEGEEREREKWVEFYEEWKEWSDGDGKIMGLETGLSRNEYMNDIINDYAIGALASCMCVYMQYFHS